MFAMLFFKACLIWLLIASLAVANGALRDFVIAPYVGGSVALPISGLSLSIIVFVVTYFFINTFGNRGKLTYFFIGVQWVSMTLLFELILGRMVGGKSWSEIFQIFNIAKGDLFILVLTASLISPLLAARVKGLI